MSTNEIQTWAIVAAAVFAAAAAAGSLWSARETRQASRALLISELLSRFWSERYRRSSALVSEWQESYGEQFAERFAKKLERWGEINTRGRERPVALEVDEARREIKAYYQTIWKLCKGGYLKEYEAKEILTGPVATELLLDVIEPLEKARAVRPFPSSDLFDFFDSLYEGRLPRRLRRGSPSRG